MPPGRTFGRLTRPLQVFDWDGLADLISISDGFAAFQAWETQSKPVNKLGQIYGIFINCWSWTSLDRKRPCLSKTSVHRRKSERHRIHSSHPGRERNRQRFARVDPSSSKQALR